MSEFTAHDPQTHDILYRLVAAANSLQALTINPEVPKPYRDTFKEHLKSVRAAMRELNRLDKKLDRIHNFTAPAPTKETQ